MGLGSRAAGAGKPSCGRRTREACRRVDQLVERLQRGVADIQLTDIDPSATARSWLPTPDSRSASSPTSPVPQFEAAVEKVREYINAGDAFQIVLSQRFRTETRARPFDIYRALRVVNP